MAQGNYGTPTNPLESVHGEQWVLTPRTSDPSSPAQGEMWLRTDLNSGDKIATVRFQAATGTVDVPVFGTGTSDSSVEEVLRIQTPNGKGFIPLTNNADYQAEYPQLGFQHGGTRYSWHDNTSAIPDSGVTRYKFEQDLLDAWDGNDGTAIGAPSYTTTSKYGTYAVSTDGVDDAVDTGIASLSTPFSIACWINPQSLSGGEHFISNFNSSGGDLFLWNDGGVWEVIDDASSQILNGGTTQTGSYTLATITRGDSEFHLYINDAEEGSATGLSSATYNNGETFTIGAKANGADYTEAYFDNWDLYDKMLSATEVSNLYNTGSING